MQSFVVTLCADAQKEEEEEETFAPLGVNENYDTCLNSVTAISAAPLSLRTEPPQHHTVFSPHPRWG